MRLSFIFYYLIYFIFISRYTISKRQDYILILIIFVVAFYLFEQCCQVKEVGGVKYMLVKEHNTKKSPKCVDDCVYQKIGADEGYYCFQPGGLSSKCLKNEEGFK